MEIGPRLVDAFKTLPLSLVVEPDVVRKKDAEAGRGWWFK